VSCVLKLCEGTQDKSVYLCPSQASLQFIYIYIYVCVCVCVCVFVCVCVCVCVCVLLTPWSRILLEKLTGLQLVKKFPALYETRGFITTLPHSQVPATCPYPEPDQSSPYLHIALPKDLYIHIIYIKAHSHIYRAMDLYIYNIKVLYICIYIRTRRVMWTCVN
jgi:hypothetical protein